MSICHGNVKVSQLSTVFYKPRVIIEGCLKSDRTQSLGSSMVLSDELLGSVLYSAKGNYYWESGTANTQQVDYKEFYGLPTVNVNIAKPLAFASVSKSVTIVSSGTASSGGIVSMRYSVDGGSWATMKLTNNSGTAEWDSTSVLNGAHVVTVEAVDSNGVSSNRSVTVIVDNAGTRSIVYGHIVNFGYLLAMVTVVVISVWAKSKRSPKRIRTNPRS